MKNLKIEATSISPIHIGSGDIYEPINFIIDDNILYYFKEEDFFNSLNSQQQKTLMNIIEQMKNDSFIKIHKFVKEHKEVAKKIAKIKVATSKGISQKYNNVAGRISNIEARNIRVFNKFEIQRTQRKQFKTKSGKYLEVGYIPGSSLKGAISTAYQEYIYHKEGERNWKNKFQNRRVEENIFKNVKISDSKIKAYKDLKIGFSLNKERFEDDKTGPSTFIEVLNSGNKFIFDMSLNGFEIKDFINSCNNHYKPIFDSLFDEEYEATGEYLSNNFKKYQNLKLKPNQFLVRVGKHSGARTVTIDGIRDITVRENKTKKVQETEETTVWLFGDNENQNQNLLSFGWLLCEIIEEKEL